MGIWHLRLFLSLDNGISNSIVIARCFVPASELDRHFAYASDR